MRKEGNRDIKKTDLTPFFLAFLSLFFDFLFILYENSNIILITRSK